jgi:hypothetical protein
LLLSGLWLEGLARGQERPSDAELCELWDEICQELLDWHVHGIPAECNELGIAYPGRPGTRPWAWWRFDAPEPRRQVVRYVDPDGNELRSEGPADHFGRPRTFNGFLPEDMYETELAYLRRRGLLFPAERG